MLILRSLIGSVFIFSLACACAEEAPPKPLIDFGAADVLSRISSEGGNAGATAKIVESPQGKTLEVTIPPGPGNYPGISIKPDGAAWDLSAFGHVEARIANISAKPLNISLRVDNNGDWRDNPWNSESSTIKPGATGTVSVIFGYSYGRKPGYALKSNAVSGLMLFTGKLTEAVTFRVDAILAAGPAREKPPVDPKSVRIKPANEFLLGPGSSLDSVKQLETKGGVQAAVNADQTLRAIFPAGKGEQWISLKPALGRWDLGDATEIRVKVKNTDQSPLTPRAQLFSDGGSSDQIAASSALAPGAQQEIVVPFVPAVTWKGIPNSGDRTSWEGVKGTGTRFSSNAAASVRILAIHEGEATLMIESIRCANPIAEPPDWLGQRPPVEGEWTKTFDDEFDGAEIDQTKWSFYGPNYWDKTSHWSKDDVIVGGGVAKLRYEKKTGRHNDDPKGKESRYAAGFLESFDKWKQRYGYFETRVKLPTAPGLWPAFWMMPDRGAAAGAQRRSTGEGGMEFDIMEHLTRWGPHRYNIAMHWDGYQKAHKQTGNEHVYVQADKDGFITCGLLWTPGMAVYYCNGKEVSRWEDPRVSTIPSYMMFTLPTGGWDNDGLDDAKLPAEFVIDYVRVWQRKDLEAVQ